MQEIKSTDVINVNTKDGTNIQVKKFKNADNEKFYINIDYQYNDNDGDDGYTYDEHVNTNISAEQYPIITKSDWKDISNLIAELEVRICDGLYDLYLLFNDNDDDFEDSDQDFKILNDESNITIKEYDNGTIEHYDENGRIIYHYDEYGDAYRWKYDENGKCIEYFDGEYDLEHYPVYHGDILVYLKDDEGGFHTHKYDEKGLLRVGDKITGTGIYDGVPITRNGQLNSFDASLFTELNEIEQQKCIDWVKNNFINAKGIHKNTSYGLKHRLDDEIDIYLTDNQFKHLMLVCGFNPVDETELQWRFRIKYNK